MRKTVGTIAVVFCAAIASCDGRWDDGRWATLGMAARDPLPPPEWAVVGDPAASETRGATLEFTHLSFDLDEAARQALDQFGRTVTRARVGAVAVQGRANEHIQLGANLELAERRAQVVSRFLLGYGLGDVRFAVLGRESPADDPRGRRCDLELLWQP